MIDLQALEIFCFSAAAVIDLALLFSLLEKRNWQRVMLPVILLILGSSLFHGSAAVHIAFSETTIDWAHSIHWSALLMMAGGLLLMPSAVLHCVLLVFQKPKYEEKVSWYVILLYLPMLALIFVIDALDNSPSQLFMETFAPILTPFMWWLGFANTCAAVGFHLSSHKYQEPLTQRFLKKLALLLISITLINEWVVFYGNPTWPSAAPYLTLLSAMTPLMLAFLLAYYMVRYQLMQLIIERSGLYGVIVIVVLLFHHIFLGDLFKQLSQHAKTDLVLLEGALLLALIVAIQPLRQRVAEALRYLLGTRVSEIRDQTRLLSSRMRHLSGQSPAAIIDWFVDAVTQVLNLKYAVVWLFNRERDRVTYASNRELLRESTVFMIGQSLRKHQQLEYQPHDMPDPILADEMHRVQASLALLLDNEDIAGVVLIGPLLRGKQLNDEQRTALVLLIEQLSITLHNSELQASRIAAERQAIHNEKLATLGLVASSIAHEIKNPLSSIKTIVTVMTEDQPPNNPYTEDLQIIAQEMDRLSSTVTRLLKFVRPTQATSDGCDIVKVIEDTLRIMKHIADKQNIQIETKNQSNTIFVSASENTVRDIIFNLIANAIDAVGKNGHVKITCGVEERRVRIQFRDSGPGISPEIQNRLYEPFITSKDEGTGLGLYMVGRHILELNGKIDYHFENGAVFNVELPCILEPAD